MNSQFLVVKIQSILSGSGGDSDERSIALEYRKRCADTLSRLEHCVSLIRAGRDYAALQVAETEPKLLESINELSFKNKGQWREYCESKSLPVAPDFDDEQVSIVHSLYSRGITQAHPLYRDYRRAMRLRDLDKALSVINSIKRVNSFDAEVKREYTRLLDRAIKIWLADAIKALGENDESGVIRNCSRLEPYSEELSGNEEWKKISEEYLKIRRKSALKRCGEILEKLRESDSPELLSEEILEFGVLRDSENLEFSEEDSDFYSKCAKALEGLELEEARRESAMEAKNDFAVLAADGAFSGAKLKRLKSLYSQCSDFLEPEEAAKARSKISSVRRRVALLCGAKIALCVACLAAIALLSGRLYDAYKTRENINSAIAELAEIASDGNAERRIEKLSSFERENSSLINIPQIASRMAKLKSAAESRAALSKRMDKAISALESLDVKNAKDSELENANSRCVSLLGDLSSFEEAERLSYSDRLGAFSSKLKDEVESRLDAARVRTRELLDEYEKLSALYGVFENSMSQADKRINEVLVKLSPLIERKSELFSAHASDIARFNSITSNIAEAREIASSRDAARAEMRGARNLNDYFASIENLAANFGGDISEKVALVLKKRGEISEGLLAKFSKAGNAESILNAGSFAKSGDVYDGELIRDVWVYKNGRRTIYTAGQAAERRQSWSKGSETVQEVREIYMGGRILKNIYRLSVFENKAPRGEILTDGKKTLESQLADMAASVAKKDSVLASVAVIANTNVNSLFKARLELKAYKFMKSKGVDGGLSLSEKARERMKKLEKFAADIADYSWMFEGVSREKQLETALYSEELPNFKKEAEFNLKMAKILAKNPLKFSGFADSNGVAETFLNLKGAQWAVASDGKFKRFKNGVAGESVAPFSPILTETKSIEEARKEAESSEKNSK